MRDRCQLTIIIDDALIDRSKYTALITFPMPGYKPLPLPSGKNEYSTVDVCGWRVFVVGYDKQ
jgi:hypothetical protein